MPADSPNPDRPTCFEIGVKSLQCIGLSLSQNAIYYKIQRMSYDFYPHSVTGDRRDLRQENLTPQIPIARHKKPPLLSSDG